MDCDHAIIGSGFERSMPELRLAEKGYRVVIVSDFFLPDILPVPSP